MNRHERRIQRHERRLLRKRVPTRDSDIFNYRTEPRFQKQEDGSVWNGSYSYSAELWEKYVTERRNPDRRHAFVGGTQPIFLGDDPVSRAWPLRAAECSRCGEVRQVSWFIDPTQIRDRWCVR